MTRDDAGGLRNIERWLRASAEEAERLLPSLLALPAPALAREFRTRPELRTPGMMQCLLRVAHDALDRLPARAHELTVVVLRYAPAMAIPPGLGAVQRIVQGEAWREYAGALREIGRPARARRALATARSFFAAAAGSGWYLATVDLLEAPLLHDLGHEQEALDRIRRAAAQFALFHDEASFLQARMLEVWMLRAAGDLSGAAELWRATASAAERHGDAGMAGRLAARMGMLELRHGHASEAMDLLRLALDLLAQAGLRDDEIRARWHYADAAAERGRSAEALSEYYRVRGELLARGELIQSAIASVAILDLLLESDRVAQVAPVAATFLDEFSRAGMPITAIGAFTYLRARAEQHALSREDLETVRTYFEDLPQNPYARFCAPR